MCWCDVCVQLEGPVQTFRSSQDRLSEIREKYKTASTSVNELARELAQVSITQYIKQRVCIHSAIMYSITVKFFSLHCMVTIFNEYTHAHTHTHTFHR